LKNIQDVLVGWGPLGLFLLALIESMGIPNPGGTDAVLLVLAIARPDIAVECALLASLGSLAGSLVFYEITRKGGETLLARYTARGRGARFKAWYQRYGMATVFIAALVPLPIMPFKVLAACAGATGVRRGRYLLVLACARIPRYAGLAFLGAELGANSTAWLRSHLWLMGAIAAGLFVAIFLVLHWSDRKNRAAAARS
jgi:membrane protein DedA with SNARE-associated domain